MSRVYFSYKKRFQTSVNAPKRLCCTIRVHTHYRARKADRSQPFQIAQRPFFAKTCPCAERSNTLKTVSWPTRPTLTWRCGILRAPYSSHSLIISLQHCRTVQRLAQAAGHPPAPIGPEAPTAACAAAPQPLLRDPSAAVANWPTARQKISYKSPNAQSERTGARPKPLRVGGRPVHIASANVAGAERQSSCRAG